MAEPSIMISAQELQQRLHGPEPPVVLDCSWFLPNVTQTGAGEYAQKHIPGARFWDLNGIADKTNKAPHMLPTPAGFAQAMGGLGISRNSPVVVYDCAGIFSAPRVFWTLKVFGHPDVSLLNGGLPAWVAAGYEVESGEPAPPAPTTYPVSDANAAMVAEMDEMVSFATGKAPAGTRVMDARAHARFTGEDPEPRPDIASGHIPGAESMPFGSVLNTDKKQYKSAEELQSLFAQRQLAPNEPVILSCGSGVTASVVWLALYSQGFSHAKVYDGSWSEWGVKFKGDQSMIAQGSS